MLAAAISPALPIVALVSALIFGVGAGTILRSGAEKLFITEVDKLEMKKLLEKKYRKDQYYESLKKLGLNKGNS
jgi:hypothetical protein